jgi:hypothetical protein
MLADESYLTPDGEYLPVEGLMGRAVKLWPILFLLIFKLHFFTQRFASDYYSIVTIVYVRVGFQKRDSNNTLKSP